MKDSQGNVKQDLNFLEFPLWRPIIKDHQKVVVWTDIEGYEFTCVGTPNKTDIIVLYYILLLSQQQNWNTKIVTSKYKVLQNCGIYSNKVSYDRLEKTLNKWTNTTIQFNGVFYNKKNYETITFSIINEWFKLKKDNKIHIHLNEFWLQKIRNSNFFKYISFSTMVKFKSPVSLRLYEILCKSFYKRDTWEIDIHKLGEKIPLKEKFTSKIIEKIKPSVNQINKISELNIKLDIIKQDRNKGKFIFKLKKLKELKQKEFFDSFDRDKGYKKDIIHLKELISLIPEKFQESSIEYIQSIDDSENIKKCILMINELSERTEIKNYTGYLRKCYENEWFKNFGFKTFPQVQVKDIPVIKTGMKIINESGQRMTIQSGNVIRNTDNQIVYSEGLIIKNLIDGVWTIDKVS